MSDRKESFLYRIDLVAVTIGLAIFLGSHVLIWKRMPLDTPRIFLLAGLGIFGIGMSILADIILSGFSLLRLSFVVWVDLFFVILYMFIYAGIARSVSLTILSRIYEIEGNFLEFDSAILEYGESSRFEERISLMEDSGFLELTNDKVTLTPKGTFLAQGATFLSWILGTRLQG